MELAGFLAGGALSGAVFLFLAIREERRAAERVDSIPPPCHAERRRDADPE
jgi:hypothetical protein